MMSRRHNILFLHQSADLYGSDKVLLAIVSRLVGTRFHPIVALPLNGPLVTELKRAGVECHVLPLTRLSRGIMSLRGLLGVPGEIALSFSAIDNLLQGRPISLVHSNTLAVLTGALWARRHRVPHVWHVHEIIRHPRFVRTVYGYFLKWFADRIVCISQATQANLIEDQPALESRCRLVWNGISRGATTSPAAVSAYRDSLRVGKGEVLLALVGRINRWKGQLLLVEAAGQLWQRGVRDFRIVIVGSVVPGQEHLLQALDQAISASPAHSRISVQSFTSNIWTVWDSCDVAIIPSIEPEPFGMVALEAMSAGKPIVAAGHGGLTEIIVPGLTGWLVTPRNALALADALQHAITDPCLRERMGQDGLARYKAEFTLDRQMQNMMAVYDELVH